MAQELEVGLFVDFENIRYGLLNSFGLEPDPQALMDKARKYGPVAVAYAYADFADHPPLFRRKLEIVGITPRDIPRRGPDAVHRSSADMAMLMDIIDCLLDRPHVNTLVLMTGDSDFIRVTARARNRFGKQVVVCGVPGSVSTDLIESADLYDPFGDDSLGQPGAGIESSAATTQADDETRLLKLIVWLDEHRPYMTFGFIRSHALSPHHGLGLSQDRVTELLTSFKDHSVLIESHLDTEDGRTLRTLELNERHSQVQSVVESGTPEIGEGAARTSDETGGFAEPGRPMEPSEASSDTDARDVEPQDSASGE